MTGDQGFNQMLFEDVSVPKRNVGGALNQGWLVAVTAIGVSAEKPIGVLSTGSAPSRS